MLVGAEAFAIINVKMKARRLIFQCQTHDPVLRWSCVHTHARTHTRESLWTPHPVVQKASQARGSIWNTVLQKSGIDFHFTMLEAELIGFVRGDQKRCVKIACRAPPPRGWDRLARDAH